MHLLGSDLPGLSLCQKAVATSNLETPCCFLLCRPMRRCWPPKGSALQHCLLMPGAGGRCFREPWTAATALTTCRLKWPGTMTTWKGPTCPCPVATRQGRMLGGLQSCRSPTCPCPARPGSQPCMQVAGQHAMAVGHLSLPCGSQADMQSIPDKLRSVLRGSAMRHVTG